jgi:hypothetical protein
MAKITISNRYGVIPVHLLNDTNISFKAKGLYGYIQSKPDNWDFSVRSIIAQSKDSKDSVSTGLVELEQAGYLKRVKKQDEKGLFEIEYMLYESPQIDFERVLQPMQENPLTEKPLTENPLTEKPLTENPETNSNNILSKNIYSKKEERGKTFFSDNDKFLEFKNRNESIIEKITKTYSINEVSNHKVYARICRFLFEKESIGELKQFEKQFESYLIFKNNEKSYLHSLDKFLGWNEGKNMFCEGVWNSCDWAVRANQNNTTQANNSGYRIPKKLTKDQLI